MDDYIIANFIETWFATADFNQPRFLSRNPVAKIIKEELNKRGLWRSRARGRKDLNSKKAKDIGKETQLEKKETKPPVAKSDSRIDETQIKEAKKVSKAPPPKITDPRRCSSPYCGEFLISYSGSLTCPNRLCENSDLPLD